jgi:IS5 family transposase
MKQLTLAAVGFERYAKTTRRAAFLAEMEHVVPWSTLCELTEPFYPKPGNGRPPVGVERMLRIYFLQQWFNLSDPAVEEALYDSLAMRRFVGVDLGREPVPDDRAAAASRALFRGGDHPTVCASMHRLVLSGHGWRLTRSICAARSGQERPPALHRYRDFIFWSIIAPLLVSMPQEHHTD